MGRQEHSRERQTFLVDFDNTLADADRMKNDIQQAIASILDSSIADAYAWLYEQVRNEGGGVDIPLTIAKLHRTGCITNSERKCLATIVREFPYRDYVFPEAPAVVEQLSQQGTVLILSDGDPIFQNHKIVVSGLSEKVAKVIVAPQKVELFTRLEGFFPAEQYYLIDDKPVVLNLAAEYFGRQVRTIHVRQGHYAQMAAFEPWLSVGAIGSLLEYTF